MEAEKDELAKEYRQLAHQYDWNWVLKALELEPYVPKVSYWILPSNNEKFKIHEYLNDHEIVDWKQYNNFLEGDIHSNTQNNDQIENNYHLNT